MWPMFAFPGTRWFAILATVLACMASMVSARAQDATFRRGDLDANGKVEITDAVNLLLFLFLGGGTPSCLEAADFDDSGEKPDISDAVNILQFLFLGGAAPPAPGPFTCGPDPTKDALGCAMPCNVIPVIRKGPLIRGYLAVASAGDPEHGFKTSSQVFIPGIEVFIKNDQSGVEGPRFRTDLSGRFTLLADGEGNYRVCWNGLGFVSGCSDIFSVGNDPIHLGTIRILPERRNGTSVVLGKVRMNDASPPRVLEPMAGINAFARVILLDAGGNVLQEVYVNDFGDYLLPVVPVNQPITLRATIEGAEHDQPVLPDALLGNSAFNPIDLLIDNTPPRLDP